MQFNDIQVPIYARDLRPEILTDSFMGKGFESKLKFANEKNAELIVGYYLKTAKVEM
jgi:hypothetical protein